MLTKILLIFNSTRKKTFFQTHFQNLTIQWKLENFPLILHKPTFVTYLEKSSGFAFSVLTLEKIYQAITHLQNWFSASDATVQKYLGELDNLSSVEKSYLDFLTNCYVVVRDFIEKSLIPWVFEIAFGTNHEEQGIYFDPNRFFKYQQEVLVSNFQNQVQKILKILLKTYPDDEIFLLLNEAYLEKKRERIGAIKFLKQQAKIENEL